MQFSDFIPPIFFKALNRLAPRNSNSDTTHIDSLLAKIDSEPLNATLHVELAEAYATLSDFPSLQMAYAEYCTAQALDAPNDLKNTLAELHNKLQNYGWSIESHSHNEHFRLATLADKIKALQPEATAKVLDVGGGRGTLSLLLDCEYILAEPLVNGIDGTRLPFADDHFDIVCACHVLEHVPPEQRPTFLDNLCAKASKHVLILNPFVVPDSYHEERLQLIVELTDANWAKEHLDCGLPTLDEVESFAAERNVKCDIQPNHCLTSAFNLVLVEHYARLAGRENELSRIHELLNRFEPDQMTNSQLPVAHLVHFELTADL